ncbi:uncharacterized protein F4807DRAFT_467626 [Annulohypoxylon truncatum]|uniref:uncharacterized protein n=1 Tax=Annulohypoxylon truncatum TaxID=327061 RepID=UPI002007563B|nr:uncharacterized protein F4807DRAFT_467626 [Annulohypoxylon truncatum]KAI1209341.1 hypothetical protein F4807DRAFT_467626 [Annulohypoxylon truncatum]
MAYVGILRPVIPGPFKANRSIIQPQPGPGGRMNTPQHIATGGPVVQPDVDEPLTEFGDYEQIIYSREVDKDPYRSHFSGFNAPASRGSIGGGLGGFSSGGSGNGGFGHGGPSGSGSFSGPSGGSGPGNINPNNFIDDDNPPLPPGPNRITVGLEIEFALAVTRRFQGLQDPHPNDGRWQSVNLVNEKDNNPLFRLSLRNLVIDTLRRNGVVANKTQEDEFDIFDDQSWLFDLNDGPECPNLTILNYWQPYYEWDQRKSLQDNCVSAAQVMSAQFIKFHNDNSLEFHRTRDETLEEFADKKLPLFIEGLAYQEHPDIGKINEEIARLWLEILENERKRFEESEGKFVDSNCVQIPGADPKYYAWTCSVDESIAIDSVIPRHYVIPNDSLLPPADPNFRLIPLPPGLYKWWPGELKSPIYDYDNPATLETIRKACAALRNTYRIHKPMSAFGTGLHVHFGQERGWTLLQLKKFTTLWLLLEQSLEKLHRKDRSHYNAFACPLRSRCPISHALFGNGQMAIQNRQRLPDTRNRNPQRSYEYKQLMNMHVPFDLPASNDFTQAVREIIAEVWQYDTISGLNDGMTSYRDYGYVMYRLRGHKITTGADNAMQTLEVRLMQGTFDADHIWRWMSICQGMIRFSRDSTPQQFNNGLRHMLLSTEHPGRVMNIPVDYFNWFNNHKDANGYFRYPDDDVVNWADPFMVPGYADVYTGLSSL